MHEFSLAQEVISLSEKEAARRGISKVREIVIEVGDLSGVEADAFGSALDLLARSSILENAVISINRISGTGLCNACNHQFDMHSRTDQCPLCRSFPSQISGGLEFRVVSMVVDYLAE